MTRVGYEVTITRLNFYTRAPRDHDPGSGWQVQVKRLSDDQEIGRKFWWHWRARRFALSTRRIDRAFDLQARRQASRVERLTLGCSE